jgi:hypothetical protein
MFILMEAPFRVDFRCRMKSACCFTYIDSDEDIRIHNNKVSLIEKIKKLTKRKPKKHTSEPVMRDIDSLLTSESL